MSKKTHILFILSLLFSTSFQQSWADEAHLETNSSGVTSLYLSGEYGGLSHTIYNSLEFLNGDPSFLNFDSGEKSGYESEKTVIDEEEMDGWNYQIHLTLDDKSSATLMSNSTVQIEGNAALYLLRALYLMSMSYPENFEILRTNAFGEITINDLFSHSLSCQKFLQTDVDTHLENMTARCILQP